MDIRNLDLNLLIVFDAVYTIRNVSKAAERLDLSQPTVSYALAKLRKQLDDPLFVRSGNGVSPTARAIAIAEPIKNAIENLRHGLTVDTGFDLQHSERCFKLMVADPMEPVILPHLIEKIQNTDGITLELLSPANLPIEQALLEGDVDAVVFLQPARNDELFWEPLCPMDLVFIVRKGHPGEAELDNRDFLAKYGHVTINLRPGAVQNSSKFQMWRRMPSREVCLVNRLNSIPNIVANSDLLAVVPNLYARKMADRFDLQVIKPRVKLGDQQIFLTWRKNNQLDSAHQWLREEIRNAVKKVTNEINASED